MIRSGRKNKLCWDANNAVGLPKQKNSYQSSATFLSFESPTALFASQHNLFRTMWPNHAKGLFIASVQTEKKTFVGVLSGNLSLLISFTLLKIAKLNLEKYRLAEIVQLSTRGAYTRGNFWVITFGTTYEEAWVSCCNVVPIDHPRQPLV